MSLEKAESRIKAQVWQAIAQGTVDLSGVPKESLEGLVNLVTEAALVEMNDELGQSATDSTAAAKMTDPLYDGDEDILWQGRPFLSIVTYYTITDERIRIQEGLLAKDHTDVELVRIQSMDFKQTFGERLMKIGDVTIRSHDPKHPLIILNNVPNPGEVHETLRRAVLAARSKHRLSYREEM